MTKCNRSEVNLKSTAYNQNGQSYFQQLVAYNSMSAHLRRVLLAKCAVDARNESYMQRKKQVYKSTDLKPKFVKTEITDSIIDRLAYDTLYHPADFLKMNHDSKYYCQCDAQKYFVSNYDYDVICSKFQRHITCPSSPTFVTNRSEPFIAKVKSVKRWSHKRSSNRNTFKPLDVKVKAAVKIRDRYEDNSMFYESASDFLSQDISHLSSAVNTSRSFDNYQATHRAHTDVIESEEVDAKDEEAKYIEFVYEITQEIICNGLYTNEQLQKVFEKHIEENKAHLDMNRMLHEVYQLKVSLNISEESEDETEGEESEDEAEEEAEYSEGPLRTSVARPPTPPKVLNEDRVIEKLMCFEKVDEVKHDSIDSHKTVQLVDANPELHVTERDVLTSLIEAEIAPEEARKIYRRLSYKSKDPIPLPELKAEGLIEKGSNQSSHNSEESDNEEEEGNELEKSSMTHDLVTQEDKDVQV